MKITISKANLDAALKRVVAIVGNRSPLPIVSNVKLEAAKDTLTLSTTDLEIFIKTKVQAFVEREGATTLPAKKFHSIIGTLPDGDICLDTNDDNQTSIECGRSSFKLVGLNAKDFPPEGDFEEDWGFSISANKLRKAIAKVAYSRSDDGTRHVLNGVLLSVRENILQIAATDGRRLAVNKIELAPEGLPEGDVILPSKTVNEIDKLLQGDEEIVVKLADTKVVFDCNETILGSKLVEGTYPNYRRVIPERLIYSVGIPRVALEQVINRVAQVISDSSGSMNIKMENAILEVYASSEDIGEAREVMDVSYEGESFEMAFNPSFFREPIKQLEADQIVLQFNDAESPVCMVGDKGFQYIVMPMRS